MDFSVYVGTYTEDILFGTGQVLHGKGRGIYYSNLDPATFQLTPPVCAAETRNPSYLAIDSAQRHVYAVNELKVYEHQPGGSLSAFEVDPGSHRLALLNTMPTMGTDPCHVVLNAAETHTFVSNFMSGSVCVFPLQPDGSLAPSSQFIQHTGASVNKARQNGPHAHALTFDRSNKRAFVPDLGIDKVIIYNTDFVRGTLTPNEPSHFATEPGSGPRHCEFSEDGRFCYLINELSSTISVLQYDADRGRLAFLQQISTTPESFHGHNTCADIHILPRGEYLYGSNRGHDSIAIYRVDRETGLLSTIEFMDSGVKTPRSLAIDPSGRLLIVAGQDTDNLVVFAVDRGSGALNRVAEVGVPTPVCVKICMRCE
jgi:6-phosphogluconolactonase